MGNPDQRKGKQNTLKDSGSVFVWETYQKTEKKKKRLTEK